VIEQASLFDLSTPPDFEYRPDFITEVEEAALLREIDALEFSNVEMRGVVAKRRTIHFGWTYGYTARTSEPGTPMPVFLGPIRERAASWIGVGREDLAEALVTEYAVGAPIGWHRDAPMFGIVVGISLRAACGMKFRPYVSPGEISRLDGAPRRTTHEMQLAPRSAYVLKGVVRRDFEHSIPPVEEKRYSITFRTVIAAPPFAASRLRRASRA
jgi:alkylated DNA repair protein (DNA oxidative demethylase)